MVDIVLKNDSLSSQVVTKVSSIFRSEFLKTTTGKPLFVLLGIGIGLTLLFAYGFAESLIDPEHPPYSPEEASATVIRSFFAMTVFAAMMGAIIVTREFDSGTIARTIMVARNRSRVFLIKILVSIVVGAFLGGVAVVVGVPVSIFLVNSRGIEFVYSQDIAVIVIGVFLSTIFSALWGLFIGFITRKSVVAICVIALITWMIEPSIQNVIPQISGYMFTLATTGVVLDPHEELLGVGGSYLVLVGWNVFLGVIAHIIFAKKDIS